MTTTALRANSTVTDAQIMALITGHREEKGNGYSYPHPKVIAETLGVTYDETFRLRGIALAKGSQPTKAGTPTVQPVAKPAPVPTPAPSSNPVPVSLLMQALAAQPRTCQRLREALATAGVAVPSKEAGNGFWLVERIEALLATSTVTAPAPVSAPQTATPPVAQLPAPVVPVAKPAPVPTESVAKVQADQAKCLEAERLALHDLAQHNAAIETLTAKLDSHRSAAVDCKRAADQFRKLADAAALRIASLLALAAPAPVASAAQTAAPTVAAVEPVITPAVGSKATPAPVNPNTQAAGFDAELKALEASYSGIEGHQELRKAVKAAEGLDKVPQGSKTALLTRLLNAKNAAKVAAPVGQKAAAQTTTPPVANDGLTASAVSHIKAAMALVSSNKDAVAALQLALEALSCR